MLNYSHTNYLQHAIICTLCSNTNVFDLLFVEHLSFIGLFFVYRDALDSAGSKNQSTRAYYVPYVYNRVRLHMHTCTMERYNENKYVFAKISNLM